MPYYMIIDLRIVDIMILCILIITMHYDTSTIMIYICHSDIHTIHYDNPILCIMIYLPCILLYWYTMHYDIYIMRYDRLCIRVAYTCRHTCTLLLIILCLIGSYCILNKYSHILCHSSGIYFWYMYWFFCSAGSLWGLSPLLVVIDNIDFNPSYTKLYDHLYLWTYIISTSIFCFKNLHNFGRECDVDWYNVSLP